MSFSLPQYTHMHYMAPRNYGCGIRHSTLPPGHRFAELSTRPADFASADQHGLQLHSGKPGWAWEIHAADNREQFIGDVRLVKNIAKSKPWWIECWSSV